MHKIKSTLAVMALAAFAPLTPLNAAPLAGMKQAAPHAATSVETVAWRGHHGWRGGRHWGGGWHRHHGAGLGIVGGVIAGALIADAIRSGTAGDGDIARCESAYRSFDASTGTYMGYDGQRHVCPYLR